MSDCGCGEAQAASGRGTVERSREVREWLIKDAEWADDSRTGDVGERPDRPAEVAALSLSGGGIRSATFSLGIIQALAISKRDALAKVDILSTVSGGGYIGCFLRSLFVPQEARGIAPGEKFMDDTVDVPLKPGAVEDQRKFARAVLSSGVNVKDISWPPKQAAEEPPTDGEAATEQPSELRRNPLWWLREHSRYLAPNGATDYGYAVAYLSRNWLAMLYIFFIASLSLAAIVVLGEAYLAQRWPGVLDWTWRSWTDPAAPACAGGCRIRQSWTMPVSPLTLLLLPVLAISLVYSIAYWLTESMSANEPKVGWQRLYLLRDLVGTLLGAIAIGWITRRLLGDGALADLKTLAAWKKPTLAAVIAGGMGLTLLAILVAGYFGLRLIPRGPLLTTETRRRLTNRLASSNLGLLIVAGAALVDTLGAELQYWFRYEHGLTSGTAGAAMLPVLAFLLKKLPEWFKSPGKSSFGALIARFLTPAAFVAGFVLYGMLAVAAAALLHAVAWPERAWLGTPQWEPLLLVVAVVLVLGLMSGMSSGFINLSSLHGLYASRLTRAYLGASNTGRLVAAADPDRGSSIKDSDPADYIQPSIYCRADLPAPIHIVNATINETIDPHSQIVARDRKGDIISLEPRGVRIGRGCVEWKKLGDRHCAEHISLGQWCAISGAAASSGMGRLTNLGFALALTFANLRLGYWWHSPGVSPPDRADTPGAKRLSKLLGTFIYLFNEMTARYSRSYERKYLTDGGHFEDTGAYRLIEHRVPLILLSDNGADPNFRFVDLENLVRLVRLDFGVDLELLGGSDLETFLCSLGAADRSIFVDATAGSDWRDQFAAGRAGPYVLVLRTVYQETTIHILWIKPRVILDMPADLMGYSAANPAFPQQTTGDQFFDEAQWESYRKLGELCTERLLAACPKLFA